MFVLGRGGEAGADQPQRVGVDADAAGRAGGGAERLGRDEAAGPDANVAAGDRYVAAGFARDFRRKKSDAAAERGGKGVGRVEANGAVAGADPGEDDVAAGDPAADQVDVSRGEGQAGGAGEQIVGDAADFDVAAGTDEAERGGRGDGEGRAARCGNGEGGAVGEAQLAGGGEVGRSGHVDARAFAEQDPGRVDEPEVGVRERGGIERAVDPRGLAAGDAADQMGDARCAAAGADPARGLALGQVEEGEAVEEVGPGEGAAVDGGDRTGARDVAAEAERAGVGDNACVDLGGRATDPGQGRQRSEGEALHRQAPSRAKLAQMPGSAMSPPDRTRTSWASRRASARGRPSA